MAAREETERGRKAAKEWVGVGGWGRRVFWCARKDSRPEEKAKEPRGRAESERRRRVWYSGEVMWDREGGADGGLVWVW